VQGKTEEALSDQVKKLLIYKIHGLTVSQEDATEEK